jgi:hypothetical protein
MMIVGLIVTLVLVLIVAVLSHGLSGLEVRREVTLDWGWDGDQYTEGQQSRAQPERTSHGRGGRGGGESRTAMRTRRTVDRDEERERRRWRTDDEATAGEGEGGKDEE